MNSAEASKIYDCLSSRGSTGTSLLTIAKETQITIPRLRKYLSQFSKSFVRVGTSPKYAINTFNSDKNYKQSLLAQVDEYNKEQTMLWFSVFITIGAAITVSIRIVAN